ncbi:MAG: S41 family peptidase, partial [Clostridia bacterium]|nr:S41 family peptidase [Clostridia bacterium]
KGEENTSVTLTVRRDGHELAFTVTRGSGQRQMTEYRMLSGGVLYIKIHSFHGNAAEYFKQAIKYGKTQNFTAVLIDLRENLGGDVTVFDEIADVMLPEGETFYAMARNGKKILTCESDAACVDKPVAVLINGSSASASEALAGTLRDMGGAVLVGTKSYGKGIMQTSYPLANGGVFKLTTAYYYLPGGDCIHGQGLTPAYTVELPEELTSAYWLRNEENDLQMQKAIEVLTKN